MLVVTVVLYSRFFSQFRMQPGEENLEDGPPIHGNTRPGGRLDRRFPPVVLPALVAYALRRRCTTTR